MENEPPEKPVRRQHVALPDWLCQYHKPWVKDDVTAGLTTGAAAGVGARRTLKTCWHVVHFTVTPESVIRASSNSYSVWQRSQRTSIAE